ncbi:MAG TPA: allantoinase AllB [Candidatus Limnocylindria bacterium]|nr:allantoinase AllB [Candidatus Limnocylindria bacterium]
MDLAIRGAIVISDGAYARDILIRDGRVSALVEPGASSADDEIDARGLLAMPGVVDAHVHFNDPGRADWEGWASGSRAAAAGGVTTVIDMPLNSLPPVIDGAAFDLKRAAGERSSLVDFALWGGLVGTDPAPLRELAARGAVGVKAFLCDSGVPEFAALADNDLAAAMRAAASAGLLVAVHAEDEKLVREATDRVRASGRRDPGAWLVSRPAIAEARAVGRACAAAAESGARLHVVHLSAVEALGAIGVARRAGTDVSVETCPHYLVFDDADVLVHGSLLKCAPPIRDRANRDALWDALSGGRIDLVASDHSPCRAADKTRGSDDIFAAWGGVSGVQSLLPAVFSEALRRADGALDARKVAGFVAWRLSVKPADRFGLGARKGRIRAGGDADIVLLDPDREWTLEPSAVQTRSGLTPYAGRRFTGAVVRTLVRGTTVFRDGDFPAAAGHGRFVAAERVA